MLSRLTGLEVAAGGGIALAAVGLAGAAALVYANTRPNSSVAQLDSYAPAPKQPRLPRQVYKFNTSVLDDEDDGNEENVPGLLILHQIPRGRRTPCIAPFVLKLETFLRVYNIRYEVDFESKDARTLNSPWISLRLEDTIDAQNSFDFLCHEYDLEPDANLTQQERAVSRAFQATLQHHLYWSILLYRYVVTGGKDNFRQCQLLPPDSAPTLERVRNAVDTSAWFNGIGKMEPEEVTNMILADLEALSALISTKEYFFGDTHPSELDLTAFGMLAQILWTMEGSVYCSSIKYRLRNLKDFCWRMRKMFWPDWDACLHNVPWDEEL